MKYIYIQLNNISWRSPKYGIKTPTEITHENWVKTLISAKSTGFLKNAENNETRHKSHKYDSKVISITIISISSAKLRYLNQRRNRPGFPYNGETAKTQNESHECNSKLYKTNITLVYIINQDIIQSIKISGVTFTPTNKEFRPRNSTNDIKISITISH